MFVRGLAPKKQRKRLAQFLRERFKSSITKERLNFIVTNKSALDLVTCILSGKTVITIKGSVF